MPLSRTRPVLTLLAVPLLALALGACGGSDIADSVAERAIEAAASEDVDLDIDTDGGGVSIKGEDGETSYSAGGGLPDGFPTDIVDLVDGTIGMSVSTQNEKGEGWAVSVKADDNDAEAVFADAVGRLEAKGFDAPQEGTMVMGQMRGQQLVNDPWSVTVQVMDQGDVVGVQYIVVSGNP